VPTIGQDYVDGTGNNILFMWGEPSTRPTNYSVYLSSNITRVEANDANFLAHIEGTGDVNDANKIVPYKSTTMYWRVISNYTGQKITGDMWNFRTRPYEIIFNTRSADSTHPMSRYAGHDINSLAMVIKDGRPWQEETLRGKIDANNGMAVFEFPSDFNKYDMHYDITVIPVYMSDDIHSDLVASYDVNIPRPLALHVTGKFDFDGRINISGGDTTSNLDDHQTARSGGFPGPKSGCGSTAVFTDHGAPIIPLTNYWTSYNSPTMVSGTHKRTAGPGALATKVVCVPTELAKAVFGPGVPANPPYKGGAGGSYGGLGGNTGRGFDFGIECTIDRSYGDIRVPIPFGGSAGGWNTCAGSSGGGGIEIVATGDVNLGPHSSINANGGSQVYTNAAYPGGGGSGGSVKIISVGGKVTNKGTISANGGRGGDSTQANNTGGGGGGGRIAINYFSAGSSEGTVTATGGARGVYNDLAGDLIGTLAEVGKSGTILYTTESPKKASPATPINGDKKVYIGTADSNTTFRLTWYSGYGASTDRVYFGTTTALNTAAGSSLTATRGLHTSDAVTVAKNKTYYWQVKSDSGAVLSDIWSFNTVNWLCPLAAEYGIRHIKIPERSGIGTTADPIRLSEPCMASNGPEWDHNGDCVLNETDFVFFASNWRNPDLGPPDTTFGIPVMGLSSLRRFGYEWLDCYGRTNDGCTNNGWKTRW
jgi:hypothetical protein